MAAFLDSTFRASHRHSKEYESLSGLNTSRVSETAHNGSNLSNPSIVGVFHGHLASEAGFGWVGSKAELALGGWVASPIPNVRLLLRVKDP